MRYPNWQHSRYTGEAEALIHALWLLASRVEVPRLTTLVDGPEGYISHEIEKLIVTSIEGSPYDDGKD